MLLPALVSTLWLTVNGPHPAYVPPSALWGELKPTDAVTVAPARDHSGFDDGVTSFASAQLTVAVEPWGTLLLEATNSGLGVWDLGAAPKNPPRTGGLTALGIPKVPAGALANFLAVDLAAPPVGSSLSVLALANGAGVLLVDVSDKTAPRAVYQDGDPADAMAKSCTDALTTTSLAGKPYALVACGGVALYDLSAAAAISGVYQEVAPNPASLYPGVFLGAGKLVSTWSDSGVQKDKVVTRLDGVDHTVVTNAATGGGFDLWDVATPTAPLHLGGGAGTDPIGGVAIWRQLDQVFVAALTPTQLQVFNVTAVVKGTASDAGAMLSWAPVLRPFTVNSRLLSSRAADGTPFVSLATGDEPTHNLISAGLAGEEALYDVSDPKAPRDITPPSMQVSGATNGWWGYTYQFGWVRPFGGRFAGAFFYRAAGGVLDVQQWTAPLNRPPVITSTPPLTATVKRAWDYQVVATDPEGKTLSYTKMTGPASMSFLGPGEVSWVPTAAELGPNPVTIAVSDGKNVVLHSWSIEVSEPSDAGTADAGVRDGGAGGGGGAITPLPKSCGCSAEGSGSLLLAGLLLRRATRARRASRPSE